MVDLDLKDRKILYELDLNCRQSNTQIGKKVGLSRKVVEYRIRRMEEEGIITGYWTAINALKIGYYAFRIYINYLDITTDIKNEIIDYFKNIKNVWALLSVKAPIDLDVILWVDDIYKFNIFWNDTLEKYGNSFSEYTISILTQVTCLKKSFLLLPTIDINDRFFYMINCSGKPVHLDDIDYKLLNSLALNARIPLIELAEKLGFSSQNVKYRLDNIIKNEIIKAFRVEIDISKLGLQNFTIDLYLKDKTVRREVLTYIRNNLHVVYIMDMTVGWSDICFELMVHSLDELYESMENIERKFPDAIRKKNYWMSKTVHKERWMPELTEKDFKKT